MPNTHYEKGSGFTFIELLVTISVIAILAAIGFTSYSKSQTFARDSKRKQDLRLIAQSLELYFQKNGSYPSSEWTNSTKSISPWIPGLDTNYINELPKDPTNVCSISNTNPRDTQNCFVYAYYSGTINNLNSTNTGYILTTRLENIADPDAGKQANVGTTNIVQWPDSLSPCPYCFTIGNP